MASFSADIFLFIDVSRTEAVQMLFARSKFQIELWELNLWQTSLNKFFQQNLDNLIFGYSKFMTELWIY